VHANSLPSLGRSKTVARGLPSWTTSFRCLFLDPSTTVRALVTHHPANAMHLNSAMSLRKMVSFPDQHVCLLDSNC